MDTIHAVFVERIRLTSRREWPACVDHHAICWPLQGQAFVTARGTACVLQARQSAVWWRGVACRIEPESAPVELLVLQVQAERLALAAQYLGCASPRCAEGAVVVDVSHAQAAAALRTVTQLTAIAEAQVGLEADPPSLEWLALDEPLARQAALLLSGHFHQQQAETPSALLTPSTLHGLEAACAFIASRLHAPIALDDLEAVSGLSRRSLQYGFLNRFGLTPMQWVRRQRLRLARELLSRADSGESVTSVGLQCGFANLGTFARLYQQCFGEYPSETLRRASVVRLARQFSALGGSA